MYVFNSPAASLPLMLRMMTVLLTDTSMPNAAKSSRIRGRVWHAALNSLRVLEAPLNMEVVSVTGDCIWWKVGR